MTLQLSAMVVCFGTLLILYVAHVINDEFLLRKFLASSNAAIILYEEYFKEVLTKKFSVDEEYTYVVYWEKYKFEFANNYEASFQYENLLKEALLDYDRLDEDVRYELRQEKYKLIHICSEVRMLRWKMQLE